MTSTNIKLFQNISNLKKDNLPGINSHLKMAPELRKNDILHPSKGYKESSVLLYLYPESKDVKIIMIQRPDYDGVHGGQICFPGGKKENNETLQETALREASEEIGLLPNKVKIINKLTSLYIPPSNFLVTPYIGISETKQVLIPDKHEVSQIIELNIDFFLDEKNITKELVELQDGRKVEAPCFIYNNKVIWGATAMIMKEFVDIINGFVK